MLPSHPRSAPRLTVRHRLAALARACLIAVAFAPSSAAAEPQIEALADRLAEALAETELAAVAVVDFTDLRGEPNELGRYLAEELSTALVQAVRRSGRGDGGPALRVIDRAHLARVLDELELSATGLLDPEETREVGRIAGVDGLVTGSLVSFTEEVRVSVKVLHVGSAETLLGDGLHLPRTRTLEDLEDRPLTVRVPCSTEAPMELELDGPPLQIVRLGELEIALAGCVRADTAVHCLFTFTDRDGDRNVYVFGSTRAVLPKGASVPVERVHLGGETASGPLSRVGAALVEDVPTPASLTFEGIPSEAESIERLEIDLHGKDARFHQVPVRRP